MRIHAGQVALRARTAELEALLGSFQSVTSGLDLREILIQILEAAVRISGAAHVKVLLLDKVSNTLQVGALKGTAMPPLYSFPVGMSLSGLVAQRGESLFISNTQTDPRNVFAERDRELGIVTYLGLPIKRGDEVLGVLSFNTDGPHEYTAEEISLLTSLAAQAAIAIEHARLYAELTQHAATLEGRVRERTRDLEAARQAAEAASRAKSEFLANMSHELRTPLNATLGFSHLLLEQRAGPLSAKQIRYCENIVTAGNRLLDTIGDILTYVEMETGRLLLEPQAFAVEAAVDEVLAHVQVEAAAKQLRLERSVSRDLPALTADPARFQRILRALLGNAVKFTPPGGTITVHACTVLGQSGDPAIGQSGSAPNCPFAELSNCPPAKWLEISVTDTGIGFTPADIPRLFQQFMQLESAYTKRHAGIGIGLALAKRLVELQGGTITAVSPGEGLGEHVHHPASVGRDRGAGDVRETGMRVLRCIGVQPRALWGVT